MKQSPEPPNPEMRLSSNKATSSMDNVLTAYGHLDFGKLHTEVHLPDGRILRVPTAVLLQHYEKDPATYSSVAAVSAMDEGLVIPLIEEQLEVRKRVVETGRVRLEKEVDEHQETLDEPLAERTVSIERTVINVPVEAPPAIRQEGAVTVYSVVEEQLIVTKQLILKEEVRVTMQEIERRDTRTVTLKRERLNVSRLPME